MSSTRRQRPLLLGLLGALQNGLIGGLLYGWASLDGTLLAGPIARGGAELNLSQTTTIFSWASSVGMLSSLLLGYILDQYGPRTCSVVSHAVIGAGCVLWTAVPWFPDTRFEVSALATCFLAGGGPGIQLSIVHLANLFPAQKYLAMTCLNGTISISFFVFVLFDYTWSTWSWGVTPLFVSLGGVVGVLLLASLLFWPDVPFELEEPQSSARQIGPHIDEWSEHVRLVEASLDSGLRQGNMRELSKHESFLVSQKAQRAGFHALTSLKDRPFVSQLCSGTYLRALGLFVVTCFLANLYVASFSAEMTNCAYFSVSRQHNLARIFTSIISFGFVPSLILGKLLDTFGLDVCNGLMLLCGQLQLIFLISLGGHFSWRVVSFLAYVFFRQFLFPNFIASLMTRLGFKYFGLLNGIGFAISGMAQIFMSTLVGWIQSQCQESTDVECQRHSWTWAYVVQLGVLLILTLIPAMDHWEELARKQRIREAFGSMRFTLSLSSVNEDRPLLENGVDELDDYLSISSET